MELYSCGITIKTKIAEIIGMITAVCMRFDRAQYEVAYFINGEQKLIWMHEDEFTTESKKSNGIGFKK